jgi:hypothetical protein
MGSVDLQQSAAGGLTAHVTASLWRACRRGPEQIADVHRRRDQLGAAGLGASSVKLMLDGLAETFTAAVDEHCDRESDVRADATACRSSTSRTRQRPWSLSTPRGSRRLAPPTATPGLRHQVAHLQWVRPGTGPGSRSSKGPRTYKARGSTRSSAGVRLVEPMLRVVRVAWPHPFADIAAGAHLAGGSDWPVNPPEPMAAVHAMVRAEDPTHRPTILRPFPPVSSPGRS